MTKGAGVYKIVSESALGSRPGRETYTAMCAVLRLIKGSHTQAADVTCRVVAGRNRVVSNWVRADKTDFAFVIVVGSFRRLARTHSMGSGCCGSDILGCWVRGH